MILLLEKAVLEDSGIQVFEDEFLRSRRCEPHVSVRDSGRRTSHFPNSNLIANTNQLTGENPNCQVLAVIKKQELYNQIEDEHEKSSNQDVSSVDASRYSCTVPRK